MDFSEGIKISFEGEGKKKWSNKQEKGHCGKYKISSLFGASSKVREKSTMPFVSWALAEGSKKGKGSNSRKVGES